jgi:endonuclease YncB( thermonuclease family)
MSAVDSRILAWIRIAFLALFISATCGIESGTSIAFGQEKTAPKSNPTKSKSDDAKDSNASDSSDDKESKEVEETVEARVTKVIDGDSIKAKDKDGKELEIQIEGTDAPELKQPFGKESTEALRKLLADKTIRVTWSKKDNFDRLLAQVYLGDDHINAIMIETGNAWHFKRYNKSEELAALETKAREKKLGLWGTESPQAPWDYRKENRAPDKPDR